MRHPRATAVASGMFVILCTIGSANAVTYCAHYIGGPERLGATAPRSQCEFATLKDCRASVRERGGGTCYRHGHVARALGR
jgi:hypothetical protein